MVKRSDGMSSRYFRKYASRSWLDIIALIFGIIGVVIGFLIGGEYMNNYRYNPTGLNWIIFGLHPIIGFIIGTGLIYSIYHGSIFILDITKRYWYFFVLALAMLIWFMNRR